MRRVWTAAVACALSIATCSTLSSPAASGVAVAGKRAPAFLLEGPDGRDVTSRAYAGRPLLINVFAAWCGTCRVEEPLLVRAYARYRDRVAFLGVDEQEGVARARSFARELAVTYPIALDAGQFAASYGTTKIPETILIDARGIVRGVHRGMLSENDLERELRALVTRKAES